VGLRASLHTEARGKILLPLPGIEPRPVGSHTLYQRFPNCGAHPLGWELLALWGTICIKDIFILKEVHVQDKIYTLVSALLD
jgi:hypothetical protein